MRNFLTVLLTVLSVLSLAQSKKALSTSDYDIWNRIRGVQFSSEGRITSYHLEPGAGDPTLFINSSEGEELLKYNRAEESRISWDENYVIFRISPAYEKVRALKRVKTDKDKMPQDSLGIFSVENSSISKISPVKDFKVPEEWSGYFAYRLDEIRESENENDSTKNDKKKAKKVNKDNGYHLILNELATTENDTFPYVTNYVFAKKGAALLFESTGKDSTFLQGVYHFDIKSKELTRLKTGDLKYEQYAISDDGSQVAFLLDDDTTKTLVRNYKLNYWKSGMDSAEFKLDKEGLENNWIVSNHGNLFFSEDGSKLYFGTSPEPVVQDTSLLEDEIIQVEIWHYQDERLMTQQENQRKNDEQRNHLMVYHIDKNKFVQLANEEVPQLQFADYRNRNRINNILGLHNEKYYKNVSWDGYPPRSDLFYINGNTGERKMIIEGVRVDASVSLFGNYFIWYNVEDTAWFSYRISSGEIKNISENIPFSVADELDDHPDYPGDYGIAGWTKDDKYVLIYDRYDIWQVDPSNPSNPVNLTNGRDKKLIHRVRILDRENPVIDIKNATVHLFDETDKSEGFARLNGTKQPEVLIKEGYSFDQLRKAKNTNAVLYTKSNNSVFPDLIANDLGFGNEIKLSSANPQQTEYNWSTVELVNWVSLEGEELEGLLYKPEDFDASKKYPMIVYFYERNAHNLHQHRASFPHRSIINPNYYASRGYIIFIPDIVYRDGYPGPSCYNSIMPGITEIVKQGYIDEDRIGIQGHSWGGYQTAYLVTRTNMFACAESGAPVVNMFSAYGGIRWGSGLSRMFQYERTQSRIGGTIWDYPLRYMENSPLFFLDKVNTPVLIMHNDEDGAVPWYQGIEFFVGLRRLGKPAWMLNYNKEPHWPTKRENIVDFQIRMQHFFDHYLMGAPMPEWMAEGIPAIEKGINKGY